jgi:hypothetical protein
MKYAVWGVLAAVAVCIVPVFWAQACVAIAIWSFRVGLVREEFAPGFGALLQALPWLMVAGGVFGYAIHRATSVKQKA